MELGAPHGGGARLAPAQVHGEDAVGARGRLVHGGLWEEGGSKGSQLKINGREAREGKETLKGSFYTARCECDIQHTSG